MNTYFQVVTQYLKGLYVRNIQLDQAGIYECWAKTPLNDAMASGRVVVNGMWKCFINCISWIYS